jgi:hypothetical protein
MRQSREDTGFTPPAFRPLGERRSLAIAELVATAALTLGTLVAASVITVGMARADTANALAPHHTSLTAVALMMALVFAGMGGLTAITLTVDNRRRRPPRR